MLFSIRLRTNIKAFKILNNIISNITIFKISIYEIFMWVMVKIEKEIVGERKTVQEVLLADRNI